MKRMRGDEPEVKPDEGAVADGSVVAKQAEASSLGMNSTHRRAVEGSSSFVQPVAVAVEQQVDDNFVADNVVVPAVDLDAGQAAGGGNLVLYINDAIAIQEIFDTITENDEFKEEVPNEESEEDDADDADDSKEFRDNKSRYVLRRFRCGLIHFYRRGRLFYPFCGRAINMDLDSMIQHAVGVARGGGRSHKPITLAPHAAFGKFLWDYVRTVMYTLN